MGFDKDEIIDRARADLARRLSVNESDIGTESVREMDFPDSSLGAPIEDEMSAQMITRGWQIRLGGRGKTYEYRSNGKQMRLVNFKGENLKL